MNLFCPRLRRVKHSANSGLNAPQVSSSQLATLARIASGGKVEDTVPGAEAPPAAAGELTMDDYR